IVRIVVNLGVVFFSSRRRHTRSKRDWSSDVCSSDLTDVKRKVKMAIIDKHVTPSLSINDPDLMMNKPAGLTAATGLDALTHAIEAYVSIDATPMTDALAI